MDIFITGSSAGLGRLAARRLVEQGHRVVLHARSEERARDAMDGVPDADDVLIGDLADLEETQQLAVDANAAGPFHSVIHNAGVYRAPGREILAVNVLAPYVLTSLIDKPERLIYLSSGMHQQGEPAAVDRITAAQPDISYSDSKLLVLLLANAVARHWPDVAVHTVNPGWVPTKMGGPGAPNDLEKGVATQVWLAASGDERARASGRYLYHMEEARHHPAADDAALQQKLLQRCEEATGVPFPAGRPQAPGAA